MEFNKTYREFMTEAGKRTITLYHGGNLKEGVKSSYSHKSKRWEYGPGLYLTSHYDTAATYAKGSRKLYEVTIEEGVELDDAKLDLDTGLEFINTYVTARKRRAIIDRIETKVKDGKFPSYMIVNLIINDKAIKPSKSGVLREFLVDNGIDYNIIGNAFGWGETMLVLYNFDKVVNIEVANKSYQDLPKEFS